MRARMEAEGGITVHDYMAAANAHYYATRDPFGATGDFTTAPEISQMFGELVGLWLADLWRRAGRPTGVRYAELGPGRGTLAADALRGMRGAGIDPPVEFVETSPVLRAAQRKRLPAAGWWGSVDDLPDHAPLLIVANEFFDALPVRQFVADDAGWRELVVVAQEAGFRRAPGSIAEGIDLPRGVAATAVVERCPDCVAVVGALARRLARSGGAALIVDYGYDQPATGDTLQAVERHAPADPWEAPGERDLSAHVDFAALAEAARCGGARVYGPVGQGAWLRAMGIELRAATLARATPARAEEIVAARERLTAPDQMGRLFRVMALVGAGWPEPEGFR